MRQHRGFTLVEIMVVVVLIGILAAIVLASFSQARESSRIAKAKEELKNIEQALKLYVNSTGSMPPGGDLCTLCEFRPSEVLTTSSGDRWRSLVVEAALFRSVTGANLPVYDPWGTYYVYDNNYRVNIQTSPSVVCSLGRDKTLQTLTTVAPAGDDLCIFLKEPDDT